MIFYPDCDYYNDNKDDEFSPYPNECEDCYRYEICRGLGVRKKGRTVSKNTIEIPKIKNGSKISIGRHDRQYVLFVDHHFNWFQKKMLRFCFGFTVEDYEDGRRDLNERRVD